MRGQLTTKKLQLRSSRSIAITLVVLVLSFMLASRPGAAQAEDSGRNVSEPGESSRPERNRRQVFFYPPFSNDFVVHEFDQDRIVRNATTDVSTVDDMAGIAVIIYWSQLCPVENQCNFEMIDRILDFWRERSKKVILAVSVIGPPIERVTATGKRFDSATPDWVLHKVARFQSPSNNFIGAFADWKQMANNPHFTFPFPRYDDPRFVAEIGELVRQLGERYDGRPDLAYVRVGAGKASEDNPIGRTNGFGPGTGMPGFTNHIWTSYTRQIANFYFADFRRTRLEFNFDWMAIVADRAKNATPITAAEAQEARSFLDDLVRQNTFLAFDGGPSLVKAPPLATAIDPKGATCTGFSPNPADNTPPTLAAPYAEVEHLRQMGVPFGFEIAALSSPCSAPDITAAILRRYQPERVIFFADTAALINFLHEGTNAQNAWAVENATNFLIPFTILAELPSHETEAGPEIKRFAAKLDRIIEQFVQLKENKGGD